MQQDRGVPAFILVLDFLILFYSGISALGGHVSSASSNWFIYLLSFIIVDAIAGIQTVKNRPRNVVELSLYTQKPYMGLTIMGFVQRICEVILVVLVIIGLFTKSVWGWLGGLSLFKLVLYVFSMVGINYRFNQYQQK